MPRPPRTTLSAPGLPGTRKRALWGELIAQAAKTLRNQGERRWGKSGTVLSTRSETSNGHRRGDCVVLSAMVLVALTTAERQFFLSLNELSVRYLVSPEVGRNSSF
jgi:hypothetical protein